MSIDARDLVDSTRRQVRRRRVLAVVGGGSIPLIAGCSGDSGEGGDNGETETPEPTPDPDAFEIVSYEIPELVTTEDTYQVSMTVANRGDIDGIYTGTIISGSAPTSDLEVELEIPSGKERTWESDPQGFEQAQEVVYSFPNGEQATIQIESGSKAPRIREVNLVTEWESFGDAIANATDEAEAGEPIAIAARFEYWHDEGTYHVFRQFSVYGPDGSRVALQQRAGEELTEREGWGDWEVAERFTTSDWEPGEYEAGVQLRNEVTGEVSEEVWVEFELV